MFRAIYVVGFFTGLGYLASTLFTLLVVRMNSPLLATEIARMESIFITIAALVGFGVQQNAARLIVKTKYWDSIFADAQSAKFTLGLMAATISVCIYIISNDKAYLYLAITPFFAINVDYVLYAIGKPVAASIVSFLKNGVPYALLIILLLWAPDELNSSLFFVVVLFGVIISGVTGHKIISKNVIPKISISKVINYVRSFKIGAGSFFIEYMRPCCLLIGSMYLPVSQVPAFYAVMKLYIAYIGFRRLVVHAVYRQIADREKAKYIDFWILVVGGGTLIILFVFASEFAVLILNSNDVDAKRLIIALGACVLASSMFITSGPKIQFAKLDNEFLMINSVAFSGFLCSAFLVVILEGSAVYLFLALIFGELISAAMLKMAIRKHEKN